MKHHMLSPKKAVHNLMSERTSANLKRLQIIQTHSVSDLVRDEIVRLITVGDLVGGDKLNELTLADRFQSSRAPIREAFRALEEAGLLRREKNRGAYVREIEEPEAHELYELRASLDEMAGRMLGPRITRTQLAELEDRLSRLGKAASRGSTADYFPMNIEFHDRLVEMSGSATLLEFYRKVVDRMHLLRRINISVTRGRAASQVEHRAIVAALKTGDADRAGAAMRAHVMNSYSRLAALLRT